MTDSSNQLKLPIDPYLENSTLWWIDTFCQEGTIRRNDTSDSAQRRLRDDYHQWMRDQGVVVKTSEYIYTVDDPCLEFVDEHSMLLFILKWGN